MKIGNFDSLLEDHLEDAKIIAIPHQRDEEEMEEDHTDAPLPEVLPILPLKNTVLFPGGDYADFYQARGLFGTYQ